MAWKVHLQNLVQFGQMGYRMHIMRQVFPDKTDVVQQIVLKSYHSGEAISEKDFALSDEVFGSHADVRGFLQAMSDAAWEIGIKPKQIEDNSNELKATKFHLEDMRQLAGVKKP